MISVHSFYWREECNTANLEKWAKSRGMPPSLCENPITEQVGGGVNRGNLEPNRLRCVSVQMAVGFLGGRGEGKGDALGGVWEVYGLHPIVAV